MRQDVLPVTTGSTPLAVFRSFSANVIYPTAQMQAAPPHILQQSDWGAGAGHASKSVPNCSEARSSSTCKKHPKLQHKQPNWQLYKDPTDASTSSTIAQSDFLLFSANGGGQKPSHSQEHQSLRRLCEQRALTAWPVRSAKPLCSHTMLRLCQKPGWRNIPNGYRDTEDEKQD